MKISEDQIQALYLFTRKHFVEHFDLQTELVDHLANGIEQQAAENQNLTFDEGLQKEFKKFGVCGFNDVIEDRRKAMAKRYRKLIFRFYKEYFRLPKVLKFIAITIGLFFVLQLTPPTYKFEVLSALSLVIAGLSFFYLLKRQRSAKRKTNQKRWLMEEIITDFGRSSSLGMLPMYIFNGTRGSDSYLQNVYLEFGICVFFVAYLILFYVIVFIIPKKAEELLSETYPEYKMM